MSAHSITEFVADNTASDDAEFPDEDPANLSIRRYEPRDADAVWAIHEEALRASTIEFVEDAPADADLRAIRAEYLDAGGEFLVGEVGDEVVATGGFRPTDGAAELRRMRVRPDRQRDGYGAAMLTELETRAAERGFERVTLETHGDLTAARSLYESRGYEQTDSKLHHETGDEIVSYGKRLSSRDE